MPRRQWNDGMEIIFSDLSAASASLEIELYDRVILELLGRQTNFVFQDSFACSYINGTTVSILPGTGFFADGTQVDPEPVHRLLYIGAVPLQVQIANPHPTLPRIDLIVIQAARAPIATQNRNTKDADTGAVSSISQPVESDWLSGLSSVTGIAAAMPIVPATPAGYMVLAQVAVTAVSGIANQGAITDVRPRYKAPSSWAGNVVEAAGNYTVNLDDGLIVMNPVANAIVTLPFAVFCSGKRIVIKNISAFQITVQCQVGDSLDDENAQVMDEEEDSFTIMGDGTQFYLT